MPAAKMSRRLTAAARNPNASGSSPPNEERLCPTSGRYRAALDREAHAADVLRRRVELR
jgi:hypothetical protein